MLDIYGAENPSNVKEIQEKRNKNNLKKHGSISPFGNKEIQEKTKQTNLKRYGVKNVNQKHYTEEAKKYYLIKKNSMSL